MPKLNSPCYRCEERSGECHSTCKKYKEYKAEMSARNSARIESKDILYNEYRGRKVPQYQKRRTYKDKMKGR